MDYCLKVCGIPVTDVSKSLFSPEPLFHTGLLTSCFPVKPVSLLPSVIFVSATTLGRSGEHAWSLLGYLTPLGQLLEKVRPHCLEQLSVLQCFRELFLSFGVMLTISVIKVIKLLQYVYYCYPSLNMFPLLNQVTIKPSSCSYKVLVTEVSQKVLA